MQFDHLDEDDSSNIAHFDELCDIEGEKEKGSKHKGNEETREG